MQIRPLAVKAKSIYKQAEKGDGIRALITRYYPRGVKSNHFDAWIRELSPSAALLKRYKEGKIQWNDFEIALLSEFRESMDSIESIYMLHDLSRKKDITLLCYEKDDQPCHRHLVRELVESPQLLFAHFVPKDADYHKRGTMECHIANEKTRLVSRLANV